MLRSRIYRRVAFTPLTDADVLALIPTYHPIYTDIDPKLLILINDKAGNGRMRNWAGFTATAAGICRTAGCDGVTEAIARAALTQLGTGR